MKKLAISLVFLALFGCSQVETRCPSASEDEIGQVNSIDHHEKLINKYVNDYELAMQNLNQQKEILDNFESHQQQYGKIGLDLPGHTRANIKYYQELADKANMMVQLHKSMLEKLAKM